MHYEKLFPSRFIKGADLNGRDVTLTISHVVGEEIEEETKMIVAFEGTKKQWVVNRTNAESLALMFGPETKDWHGKRITLHAPMISNPFEGGKQTPAVRVVGSPDISRASRKAVKRGRSTINVSVTPTGKQQAQPQQNGKAVTKQALIDVQTGETEDQATARVNGEPPAGMILPGQEPPPMDDSDMPFGAQ